jgi:hypothetical protein
LVVAIQAVASTLSPAAPATPLQPGLVAHRLSTMPQPYLSLAIRTDAPDSVPSQRIRGVFAALAHHPLGERLRFVEPRDALRACLDEDAEATAGWWTLPTRPAHGWTTAHHNGGRTVDERPAANLGKH